MTDIGVAELVAEARRWRMPHDVAQATVIEVVEELAACAGVALHDGVAALVATNTQRLLDKASSR